MCLLCHQNMSDETVKEQLLESLENPQFEVWNNTSISHLTISMVGFNGYEVADLANTLFKRYILWARENGLSISDATATMVEEIAVRLTLEKSQGINDEQLKGAIRASFH